MTKKTSPSLIFQFSKYSFRVRLSRLFRMSDQSFKIYDLRFKRLFVSLSFFSLSSGVTIFSTLQTEEDKREIWGSISRF